jgi:exodeoxyribonuclease VII large subunit
MRSEPISLYELNQRIKGILKNTTEPAYWIFAEISELKINVSGHCYIELVEKDEKTEYLKAKSRATIWSSTFRMIRPYFETSAGIPLSPGIKVLVRVTVDFHELYGLSLNIIDIEPSYTVGELARKKQDIINRLTEEGVIDMNRELDFPELPKRIAVISSETAAGFGDFTDQLLNNDYAFRFYVKLFPAYMQGEDAENSIIQALENIHRYESFFDIVVIIRGGGSQADLSCFNNYRLALHVAQFPLPVLTGIGHEQDETVVDLVAHEQLKTPTAVAEYLVSCFLNQYEQLNEMTGRLVQLANERVETENDKISRLGYQFSMTIRELVAGQHAKLQHKMLSLRYISHETIADGHLKMLHSIKDIRNSARGRFFKARQRLATVTNLFIRISNTSTAQMRHHLNILENRNQYLSPLEILKRGYSITRQNGKLIKDGTLLRKGDFVDTIFFKGKRKSRVVD